MLQLIAHILVISFTCIIWGLPVLLILKNKLNGFWLSDTIGFYCFLFFAGLISLSFITSWLCLLLPLKSVYLVILTLILVVILIAKKRSLKEIFNRFPLRYDLSFVELGFIGVVLLIFLVCGTLEPVNPDTQIYHVQIIKWFNEYGTVPGLANLFPRYGLGSNWFNLISVFRLPFFSYENFTWLNTTIVIWFFAWLIGKWKLHYNRKDESTKNMIMGHFYLLLILFCLFEWELFRDAANSTNYDFVVAALTLIAICFLIESILFPEVQMKFSSFFVIFCFSIIPFKLSGIFVVLPLLFYLSHFNNIQYWTRSVFICLLIVIPFLIKNFITTGYPFYPAAWSISHPDWQVPQAMTDYLRQYIQVVNRFYNSNSVDFSRLPELMNARWVASWFDGLLFQQKILLFLSLSAVLIFFFKTPLAINHKKLSILFATLLLMAAAWFLTAPSPRFGHGVLLVLAFFPLCLYIGPLLILQLHKPVIILSFFMAGYYLYKKSQPILDDPRYLIHTQQLARPPLRTIMINGMTFYFPGIINNGWMHNCFNTALPCICNENKYLQPRGKTMKQGFKMDQQPDSIFIRKYVY